MKISGVLCVCVWSTYRLCTCVCKCVMKMQRRTFCLIFLSQNLSLNMELTPFVFQSDWLTRESQISSCLCPLQHQGYRHALTYPTFQVGAGDLTQVLVFSKLTFLSNLPKRALTVKTCYSHFICRIWGLEWERDCHRKINPLQNIILNIHSKYVLRLWP